MTPCHSLALEGPVHLLALLAEPALPAAAVPLAAPVVF